jgi:hypothetical protein
VCVAQDCEVHRCPYDLKVSVNLNQKHHKQILKVVSKCKALPCFSNVNDIETKVKQSFGPPVISISNQNKTAVLFLFLSTTTQLIATQRKLEKEKETLE